ncbi:hypothetical protein [Mucilaginibacter arboris]|uniref:Uncharacterized protein n=1 Tax=Mucilaginibacter arboris TaxID=2682090 RepID=A0A7K1T1F6_9SPHI|nr:hypothetical protein [Mucilaginibacter arboris]MVN23413.1 hypothetical protein [Mucilaginibacter arboris]
MESIIINPKDKAEFELLTQLLSRMNVVSKVISEEDQEDLGLAILMKEADRTEKVSKETIMETLKGV